MTPKEKQRNQQTKLLTKYQQEYLATEINDSFELDDEVPLPPKLSLPDSELSSQYWLTLKLVKFVKVRERCLTFSISQLGGNDLLISVWQPDSYFTCSLQHDQVGFLLAGVPICTAEFRSH